MDMFLLLLVAFVLSFVSLAMYTLLTSPFNPWGPVHRPFEVEWLDGKPVLHQRHTLRVMESYWADMFAKLRAGMLILLGKLGNGHYATSSAHDEIIRQIHQRRFTDAAPFIISGDHFSMMYPRSLGIFYHTMLDPRTALDEADWHARQAIYLKSLVYCLEVYRQSRTLSTTITPLSGWNVSLMHIYALASDTMYSLLYGMQALQSVDEVLRLYPAEVPTQMRLQTKSLAKQLQVEYQDTLCRHFETYWDEVYDDKSGLIYDSKLLSGTKDIVRRYNSFYDNVIAWRTHQLAQDLKIIPKDRTFLMEYRQRILDRFWDEEAGVFVEDSSPEAMDNQWYSSDWLIAVQTGFLNPRENADRTILLSAVDYIVAQKIDQPFGLRYHNDHRYHRLYRPVRIGAKDYASDVIWSHWGIEYIKLLIYLNEYDESFGLLAKGQLQQYRHNIVENRGYPEVYRTNGKMYKSFLYTSVRMTGWVVNYEQTVMLYQSLVGDID